MKNFLFAFVLLLPLTVCAQNVRYDSPFPSISPNSPPFLIANTPPNSPTIQVCKSPANGFPTCSNYATTYTSLGVACPNGAQDTPQPQPSACQSTGDAQGNIGFWSYPGTVDYIVCISNNCFGPFTVTLGGSGGGSGAPNQSVSFTSVTTASLTVANSTQNIVWDCYDTSSPPQAFDPATVTINPSTFLVTFNFAAPQSGYCVVNSSGGGGTASTLRSCQSGLGDGLNAISAGTYLETFCYNDSGSTWTLTGLKCFSDNSGSSTLNATDNLGNALLTGAISCSTGFASGTQSATVSIAAGGYVKFTFVADGSTKQTSWVVSVTE